MVIRCKSSNRFLGKVDTEKFFNDLYNMTGIKIQVPIKVEFTCRKCGMNEIYEVYKDKYIHIKSYKNKK